MNIGIIGAGPIGSTLGERWRAAGHDVRLGVRDSASPMARGAAGRLGAEAVTTIQSAVTHGEVVVVAIPGASVAQVAAAVADQLAGKMVIDASNNISAPVRNSLAALSEAAPTARLVRAFNSLPAPTLAEPRIGDVTADLFFCSGPEECPAAETLVSATGLNPVYVGGLEWAPIVDALGGLSFALGRPRPGVRLALKLVTQ